MDWADFRDRGIERTAADNAWGTDLSGPINIANWYQDRWLRRQISEDDTVSGFPGGTPQDPNV